MGDFQLPKVQKQNTITWCIITECYCVMSVYKNLETFRLLCYIFFPFQYTTNTITMQNDVGEYVDLFVPRKCSASNRIIHAKDHASIQINIAEVGRLEVYNNYAL